MRRLFLLVALVALPALAQRAVAPRGPSASVPSGAMPQAAAERYHEAARLYIGDQNAPALAAAEAAVALAPTNAQAVALRDLIKKKQDQQDQNQDPQDQDDQNQDSPPKDDPNDGQEPPKNDPQAPDDSPGQTPPPSDNGGQAPGQQMSPEQAERLLDAVGGDERLLLRQMRRPPSRVRTNEQDW